MSTNWRTCTKEHLLIVHFLKIYIGNEKSENYIRLYTRTCPIHFPYSIWVSLMCHIRMCAVRRRLSQQQPARSRKISPDFILLFIPGCLCQDRFSNCRHSGSNSTSPQLGISPELVDYQFSFLKFLLVLRFVYIYITFKTVCG